MKKINDDPQKYRYNLNNASSYGDCTGLIPVPPQSDEERAAYNAIYHFGLPEIDKDQAGREP